VAVALLLENAGLPVPGETVLLLASFSPIRSAIFAWHGSWQWERVQPRSAITWVTQLVCMAGGDYWIATGKSLVVSGAAVQRGEALFARYGAATILFCPLHLWNAGNRRSIGGERCGMPWKKFALFNFLGAALWVSVISGVGYGFGSRWGALMHFMKRFDLILGAAFVLITVVVWWQRRGLENLPRKTRSFTKEG